MYNSVSIYLSIYTRIIIRVYYVCDISGPDNGPCYELVTFMDDSLGEKPTKLPPVSQKLLPKQAPATFRRWTSFAAR